MEVVRDLLEWAKVSWRQYRLMLKKDFTVFRRKWHLTSIQIFSPLLFIVIIFGIDLGFNSSETIRKRREIVRSASTESFPKVARCMGRSCITIAYAPATSLTTEMVNAVAQENGVPSGEIRGFPTLTDFDNFVYDNPNTTHAAYLFYKEPAFTGSLNVSYVISFNKTVVCRRPGDCSNPLMNVLAPLQYSMDRQMFKRLFGNDQALAMRLLPMPRKELRPIDVIGNFGQFFFFLALMFHFIIFSNLVVQEKERKLRLTLDIMGLKPLSYWLSWTTVAFVILVLSILILIASGAAFQFRFFTENDFFLYFFLFFLTGMGIIMVALALSTLLRRSKVSAPFGFAFFLVFYIGNVLAVNIVYNPTVTIASWVQVALMFLPPVVLAKGLGDLSKATNTDEVHGIAWDDRYTYTDVYPLGILFQYAVLDFFLYAVLLWYLDNIVPGEWGKGKPLYFFLTPTYWCGTRRKQKTAHVAPEGSAAAKRLDGLLEDEDVAAERQSIAEGASGRELAITIRNLEKYFAYGMDWPKWCRCKRNGLQAVNDVTLGIDKGLLFCLLGPNGAGKTTLFNMLIGIHTPTAGSAEFFGEDLFSNMDSIRKRIGVCPQHDILWPELTGRQHLELYSGMKGLPPAQVPAEIAKRAKQVNMQGFEHTMTGAYSGGMQRRLSIAIALVGDPDVVYLDEPTTGLDPISRRQVWDMIESSKVQHTILLTTHSMEEADILGDRIAIMAKGRVRCLGSTLRLKNRFGAGYRITFTLPNPETDKPKVKEFLQKSLPSATIVSDVGTFLSFQAPRSAKADLTPFFTSLEMHPDLSKVEYSMSMTTLEEVFIRISTESRAEGEPSHDEE